MTPEAKKVFRSFEEYMKEHKYWESDAKNLVKVVRGVVKEYEDRLKQQQEDFDSRMREALQVNEDRLDQITLLKEQLRNIE